MVSAKMERFALPTDVVTSLRHMGASIRTARLRRRLKASDLADRIGVSLPTLRKVESGDPTVSLSTFVTALWVFNLHSSVEEAVATDSVGISLEQTRLPKRIRSSSIVDEMDAL